MKYKVKVSEWFLKHKPSPDAKLPVKTNKDGSKIELIGNVEDEVITENIQGIENDPRYTIETIKKKKIKFKADEEKKEENEEIKIKEEI